MRHAGIGLLVVIGFLSGSVSADERVFSGPQVGEKLTPFKVTGVYDDAAGKDFDPVVQAGGKPTVVVFVHKVTRPSIGLTRLLMNYAANRKKDGLHTALVFLSEDATETTAWMKRARGAIPKGIPVGISPDGKEGPGAYGLNRNMTLTVLVAKDDKVTANFALVQPGVKADLQKIVKEIVKLVGGKVPTLTQLGAER